MELSGKYQRRSRLLSHATRRSDSDVEADSSAQQAEYSSHALGEGPRRQISAIGKTSKFTVLDIEKAFEFGEVINPNKPLGRSEAILKLKESKDLFELDLISEDQYLKLKEKLTPIIMNN